MQAGRNDSASPFSGGQVEAVRGGA